MRTIVRTGTCLKWQNAQRDRGQEYVQKNTIVTRLDDLLEPLDEGVWEVVIRKDAVCELPGTGWKRSAINVPSPGTIASYRKGRFHAHETKTEWRVHLDRFDPEVNPLLHLAGDAPLLLMISDTFMTLIMDARRREIRGTEDILSTQRFIWQEQVVAGLAAVLAGLFIIRNPAMVFMNIFSMVIPLGIICLAVIILIRPFLQKVPEKFRTRDLFRGLGYFCAGILAFFLPLALWVISVLAALALWMIGSAGMLLKRVARGRSAVPEGFYSRMAIGILSLAMAVLLVVSPAEILRMLILILGAVTILLGVTLCINGLRLRAWMIQVPAV